MFEEFKDESVINFMNKFQSDDDCRDYLLHYKWKDGFVCSKCKSTNYWSKKDTNYKRVCSSCRHIESVTANTLFHKVKFSLQKAFLILFELSTTSKGISAEMMASRYELNRKTTQLFARKVRMAMSSSQKYPLDGDCEVDEAVFGGKEKGKRGRGAAKKRKISIVIETNGIRGIKRAYCQHIKDFSATELQLIFDKHIDKSAKVLADQWTGYKPIAKHWSITQEKSKPGENFNLMHRFIQQFKAWLRGIHHHASEKYFQGYLDEYCFRFNRHKFKASIFDKLIQRMVEHRPMSKEKLIYE